jgi:hypothetical protein
MLDRLVLTPEGVVLVPRGARTPRRSSSGAMGAAIAVLGVTAGSAIGGAVLLSAGAAAIIDRGFGPFTDYPDIVIAPGPGSLAPPPRLAVQSWGRRPLRNTALRGGVLGQRALFLKLLVLLHPNMPVGDAIFHAHRFQGVLRGNLYFTSIAPGGYAFPTRRGCTCSRRSFQDSCGEALATWRSSASSRARSTRSRPVATAWSSGPGETGPQARWRSPSTT